MLDRARLCDRFVPLAHILRKLLNLHKIKQETKDQSTRATVHSGRADSAYLQAYLERLDSRPAIAIRQATEKNDAVVPYFDCYRRLRSRRNRYLGGDSI